MCTKSYISQGGFERSSPNTSLPGGDACAGLTRARGPSWCPVSSRRTCKPRTELTASASRTRFVCWDSAPWTAWRKRSWRPPSTSWMWIRRWSRRACSIRSLPATSAGLSCRPSWSMKRKTRYSGKPTVQNQKVTFCLRRLRVTSLFFKELPRLALIKMSKLAAILHPQSRKPLKVFQECLKSSCYGDLKAWPVDALLPSFPRRGAASRLCCTVNAALSGADAETAGRPLSGQSATWDKTELRGALLAFSLCHPPEPCVSSFWSEITALQYVCGAGLHRLEKLAPDLI